MYGGEKLMYTFRIPSGQEAVKAAAEDGDVKLPV